jgi:UDP-N-acetylmuramoyl-tripeptide--D-alanyl-D-alanine ligase
MMRPLALTEIQLALQASLIGRDCQFTGVAIDSRKLVAGDLFVALSGDNHDGHEFLPVAAGSGAVAALVSQSTAVELPQLQVADTQRALGLLGAYNRKLFQGPLVAITGSSGKTTAKNMISAVLSQRGETLATEGNYNNEIGVPLTLLRLTPSSEFAVVEMGAARAGDIAWLCQLGCPRVAVLLNAMPAHLEGFGSLDDVAAAKGEIFDALGAGDTAVINADQRWAGQWRNRAGAASIIDFGLDNAAAVSATQINLRGLAGSSFVASTPAGDMPVRLQLPGRHNVANALAAIAVGLACGLALGEIGQGLQQARAVDGRLAIVRTTSGVTLIDDCYNANPGSVMAAIDLLAECEGHRTLLLGAMLELGPGGSRLHRQMGEYAKEAGLDAFWGVGEELSPAVTAFGAGGRHFNNREQALAAARLSFDTDTTALIKGSRGAGMEFILEALQADGQGDI